MAKEKDAKDADVKVYSALEKAWEQYVENYKKANPEKYAAKIATSWTDPDTGKTYQKPNEFETIPLSFKHAFEAGTVR